MLNIAYEPEPAWHVRTPVCPLYPPHKSGDWEPLPDNSSAWWRKMGAVAAWRYTRQPWEMVKQFYLFQKADGTLELHLLEVWQPAKWPEPDVTSAFAFLGRTNETVTRFKVYRKGQKEPEYFLATRASESPGPDWEKVGEPGKKKDDNERYEARLCWYRLRQNV